MADGRPGARTEPLRGRKASAAALRALDLLFDQPVVSVGELGRRLGLTFAAISRVVERLAEAGVLVETTGQRRHRRFRFEPYLRLFA